MWVLILAIIIGDIYLYVHGARPENTIWCDEKFGWYK